MLGGQGLKIGGIAAMGLLFGIAAAYFEPKANATSPTIGIYFALFGLMLNMWACVLITRAKGLNGKWCLMGLFGLIGIGTLLFIPSKKTEDISEQTKNGADKPPSPIT